MTRSEARALGLKHYSTGEPCIHGHNCERFTSSGMCAECNRVRHHQRYDAMVKVEKPKTETYIPQWPCKEGHYLRYMSNRQCVVCCRHASKAWRTAHPDHHRKLNAAWRKDHPDYWRENPSRKPA